MRQVLTTNASKTWLIIVADLVIPFELEKLITW